LESHGGWDVSFCENLLRTGDLWKIPVIEIPLVVYENRLTETVEKFLPIVYFRWLFLPLRPGYQVLPAWFSVWGVRKRRKECSRSKFHGGRLLITLSLNSVLCSDLFDHLLAPIILNSPVVDRLPIDDSRVPWICL